MAGITLSGLTAFVGSLESDRKAKFSGFAGFSGTITQDIGAAVVDAETLGNGILAAFSASGNAEAAVVGPVVSIAEAFGNALLNALGISTTPGSAPSLTVSPGVASVASKVGSVALAVANAAAAAGSAGVVSSTIAGTVGTLASGAASVADDIDGLGDSKTDTGAL